MSDTVTVVFAPGASVPDDGEADIQVWFADTVQFRLPVPLLVSVYVCEDGVNGPPICPDGAKAALGVTPRLSGKSNASVTPVVVLLAGTTALDPMPRFAKAPQISFLFAPALSTRSACMIESRDCKNVGFAGASFMPSVTSLITMLFPATAPSLLISAARTSQSVTHHTSPWLWTSDGLEFEDPNSGLSGMPVCGDASDGSMSFSVSGFFVMSVEYG